MGRRNRLFVLLVASAAMAATVAVRAEPAKLSDIIERPPPLTFDKPVDYVAWYNDFVRRGRDEKDNAYPLYLKLCPDENGQGGFPKPEGKAAEQFDKAIGRVWTAEEFPELAAHLKACEQHFLAVEKAIEREHLIVTAPEDLNNLWDFKMPFLAPARDYSKAMIRRSWLKQPFQQEAMIETWRVLLRHAALLQQVPSTVSALSAAAAQSLVFDQALAALDAGVLRPEAAEAVGRMILREAPRAISLADGVRLELAIELSVLQWICGGDTRNDDLWVEFQKKLAGSSADGWQPNTESFPRELTTVSVWTYYDDAIDILEQSTNLRTWKDLIKLNRQRSREWRKNT